MTGSQFSQGVAGKDGMTFFREVAVFTKKKKLKSKIFNVKKSLLTNFFFSVITSNLKWEILTLNLVTFKRWDEVKDENFNILWVNWKIQFLGEGLTNKK